MNCKPILLLLIFGILPIVGNSQSTGSFISGRIFNIESQQPIVYANIYNYTLGIGTISNNEGYFELKTNSGLDSIVISYIGFNDYSIKLVDGKGNYSIGMVDSPTLLDEITITPDDDKYYIDLIKSCRDKKQMDEAFAKAYYSLKTFYDTSQIELVEGYYNIGSEGYDLQWMDLKTGRLALKPYKDRFFTSLESSLAFSMMHLMSRSYYFPDQPFNVKKRKLSKSFFFALNKKYVDSKGDSIYVIDFAPKKTGNDLFSGKVWINITHSLVEKIEKFCNSCKTHPFIPLFPTDKIKSVDMRITKTFDIVDNSAAFKHIDFLYKVNYLSRFGHTNEVEYNVETNAVLYAYDYNNYFAIPYFYFNTLSNGDFRKLNAIPYNSFFWKFNDEYSLYDSKEKNNRFFNFESTVTNRNIFRQNAFTKVGIFQHPYVKWSQDRVLFMDLVPQGDSFFYEKGSENYDYNLSVKIFLDVNSYAGTTDVLTATIFDPYESFYYLDINKITQCFINIYFDLCEIMRRKLHLRVMDARGDEALINNIYQKFSTEFEELKASFLQEVDRGNNKDAMLKWNAYIKQYLDIDNVELFKPYP